MSSGHLVPFFCPYCGEESIEPFGESAGGWACSDCRRQFTLRSGVRAASEDSKHEVRTS
jgi:transposase-like protein